MKTWPESVRRLYPLARGLWPARPWWRFGQDANVWRRRDGKRVEALLPTSLVDHRPSDVVEAEMAAQDEAAPLLFPGLRVGQVWALLAPDDSVFRVFEITDYHVRKERPWLVSGRWESTDALLEVLRFGLLLADSVCPWTAPWRT
jgi:hypothetical protein